MCAHLGWVRRRLKGQRRGTGANCLSLLAREGGAGGQDRTTRGGGPDFKLRRTARACQKTIGSNRYPPFSTFSDVMLEPCATSRNHLVDDGYRKGNRVHVLRGAPRWPGSTDTGRLFVLRSCQQLKHVMSRCFSTSSRDTYAEDRVPGPSRSPCSTKRHCSVLAICQCAGRGRLPRTKLGLGHWPSGRDGAET